MDSLLFIVALVVCACLLFLSVYFTITLSDLECDYLNATQCCSRLNKFVLVEVVAHCVVTVALLLSLHYILFLLNLPLAIWQVYSYMSKPSGNIGWFDPTEIHNRHQLRRHMRVSLVKLAHHLIFFFLYLYNMIVALLTDD